MTMRDIKEALERACLRTDGRKSNTCILRPTKGDSFAEFDPKLVMAAWAQIDRAIINLQAGLMDPSQCAAETLLLQMFQDHAEVQR